MNRNQTFSLKYLLTIPLLTFILSGCGGGSGGGGESANTPDTFPDVLVFERQAYETSADSGRLVGKLRPGPDRQLDCDNGANSTRASTVATLTWVNEANGRSGRTEIFAVCRVGLELFGPVTMTFWVIESIPLELGDNAITLNTFVAGGQIGRDTITIVRNGPATVSDQVTTSQGTLQGVIEGDLSVFRGVAYAAAPVGDLRFRAPQSPPAFSGVADASTFAPVCIQPSNSGPVGEEDCLYLNIWAHNDASVRPVIVFLHGGNGGGVGGNLPTTEGSSFADHGDAVVVTLNRRLAVMGHLALDELIQENPRTTAGNYGVLDVIAALQWLQDNIAAFNGDPNRLLLAGESAGARVICHIVAAPEAAGLFQSAAIQSGPCGQRMVLTSQVNETSRFAPSVDLHRPLLVETGCDNAADVVACLRGISAAEIVAAADRVPPAGTSTDPFGPTIDGVVVQSDPYEALANEVVGNIPIIVGSNQDEANNVFGGANIPDDPAYRAFLTATFPDPVDDQLYALYPTADYASAKNAFLTLLSDLVFNCVAEELARSAQGSAPSFLYLLSRGFDNGPSAGLGAAHAIDVPYLFETFDVFGYTPDAQALAISAAMQGAWIGLAAAPNVAPPFLPQGASNWPVFDSDNIQIVEFGDTIASVAGHRAGRCSLLGSVVTF